MRDEEAPAVAAFRAKMQTQEAKQIYRQRGPVAEFPNAWIKDKLGLRQFRSRGLLKVTREARWASLTYNIQPWDPSRLEATSGTGSRRKANTGNKTGVPNPERLAEEELDCDPREPPIIG